MPADPLLVIAALATRAKSADAAMAEALAVVVSTLAAQSAGVALLNPDSGKLRIEGRFGLPDGGEQSFALGQGIPGWAAFHGKAVLCAETDHDNRYRALRAGVHCQMAAPLFAADGQAIGVIWVDRDKPRSYGEADLARLTALAAEAAGVLAQLWRLEHLEGKAQQLEALLAVGESLVSKLDQRELLDTLTADARKIMQARAAALYLYSAEGNTVRLASLTGAGREPVPDGELPLDSCLCAGAVHTRKPISFPDIQSPEFFDLADLPRDGSLHSVLTTPIAYEGELLGVLAVFFDRVLRFDNEQKRLGAALARLAAVTLQNVRLYARVFRSEETLRKNEQLTTLGLLSAEIAHEIRNPLTVLKLLHGGLGGDLAADDPRRTDLRVIAEKLDQLEGIVTRVLTFGQAPASLHTRVPLAEIVDDTLILIRLKFVQGKIALHLHRPPEALIVDVHKGQIQQVLLNLLLNAMHAMPGGGTIALAASPGSAAGHAVATLDIADTGSGIPEAIRTKIFDSFLSGRPGGTGLGLAIAKRILQSHHGDIELLKTDQAGTTFRVTLPLARH
jgi:signal transduction histidine kinase